MNLVQKLRTAVFHKNGDITDTTTKLFKFQPCHEVYKAELYKNAMDRL
jgi:hypothetical protein